MELGLAKNKEKTIKDIQEYLATDKKNHPFDDDVLNLRSIAETLSNIISNTKDPFVYSINSPYGTGKTFFLRRLHCLLEQKQCLVVSYNAWESDFYSDPLSALINELADQIDPKKFTEKEVMTLTKASLGFSVGFTGTLNWSKKQTLSNDYQKYKDRKEKFIKALKNFTENLPFPLVFIIDELDRCRPDYAIQTLEIIKHFFNIPNITFVIGVDRKQIESTVRVLYGSNIDTCCDEYLRKFIDQDFYLPKPSSTQYIENLCNKHLTSVIEPFCHHKKNYSILYHDYLSDPYTYMHIIDTTSPKKVIISVLVRYIDALSEYFVFSLRKQEQFVISLKILFSLLSEDKDILLPELACLLTAIKLYDNSILHKQKNKLFNIFSYEPIHSYLNTPEFVKLINKSELGLNTSKIQKIKNETDGINSKFNAIEKWQNDLGKDIPDQIIEKYLQLTKQLSLLENQQ
ncbi:MAG: P-loop NTPase fold protein [Endomicrobiaceae bacterium]|nr:P-loop NTPase fold protein [Endomicrobiaceae bacterium]